MTSTYSAPLSDLMDDFAMNAMAQLIHTYAPADWGDKEDIVKWCESISSISYLMATSMMDTRTALHKSILEEFQGKEPDEA